MTVDPTRSCPGCLGSHRCWACLGHGTLETRAGGPPTTCKSCGGSGVCPRCGSGKAPE